MCIMSDDDFDTAFFKIEILYFPPLTLDWNSILSEICSINSNFKAVKDAH